MKKKGSLDVKVEMKGNTWEVNYLVQRKTAEKRSFFITGIPKHTQNIQPNF